MTADNILQNPSDLPEAGHEDWLIRATAAWEADDFTALGRCARELEQVSPTLRAQEQERRADLAAWELAKTEDSIEAYARYLDPKRPGFKFFKEDAEQAASRIEKVNDQQVWDKAESIGSLQAYYDYQARSGRQYHADEAEERISRLLKEEDALLWVDAQRKNTVEAYGEYLAHGGPLAFRDNAQIAIYSLQERDAWQSAVSAATQAGYEAYLGWVSSRRDSDGDSAWYRSVSNPNEPLARERIDDIDWAQATAEGTVSSLRAYTLGSPPRRYLEDAKDKISDLLKQHWAEACRDNNREGYARFMELCGEGHPLCFEAQSNIEKLEKAEEENRKKRQDEEQWNGICKSSDIADFEKYLQIFGGAAIHAAEAKSSIARLQSIEDQKKARLEAAQKLDNEDNARWVEVSRAKDPELIVKYLLDFGKDSREPLHKAEAMAAIAELREGGTPGPGIYPPPPPPLEEEQYIPGVQDDKIHSPALILGNDWPDAEITVVLGTLRYDLKLWDNAIAAATPEAFSRYLEMCPLGCRRLAAVIRADELKWRQAEESGDINKLKSYHESLDARFVMQARQKLSTIISRTELVNLVNLASSKSNKAIEEDNREWGEAEQCNTLSAFRGFAWKRPLRSSAKLARQKIESWLWEKARSTGSLKDWLQYLCIDPPEADEDPFADDTPSAYRIHQDAEGRMREATQRVITLAEAKQWEVDVKATISLLAKF